MVYDPSAIPKHSARALKLSRDLVRSSRAMSLRRPDVPTRAHRRARVCAIIVNWNQAGATLECLQSLEDSSVVPDAVVVVDNGSGESDRQVLEKWIREHTSDLDV